MAERGAAHRRRGVGQRQRDGAGSGIIRRVVHRQRDHPRDIPGGEELLLTLCPPDRPGHGGKALLRYSISLMCCFILGGVHGGRAQARRGGVAGVLARAARLARRAAPALLARRAASRARLAQRRLAVVQVTSTHILHNVRCYGYSCYLCDDDVYSRVCVGRFAYTVLSREAQRGREWHAWVTALCAGVCRYHYGIATVYLQMLSIDVITAILYKFAFTFSLTNK